MQSYLNALFGGLLIGAASWLLLASLGRVAGISGILNGAAFGAAKTDVSLIEATKSDEHAWRWAFIWGLVLGGAFFSFLLNPINAVTLRSPILLIVAGLLVGFGTVLGAGCTSGHGVCGLGRRSMRSFVAVCVFMLTGMATVYVAGRLGLKLI